MDQILSLKEEGNSEYAKGCKSKIESHLQNACVKYGQAIEALVSFETNNEYEDVLIIKLSLFSNLAASNIKLLDFDGCRRCCNVVILFCNKPELKLSEMGIDDDVTLDIKLMEPVLPICHSIISKTLFRRGKCLQSDKLFVLAYYDFKTALRYASTTSKKEIEAALKEIDQLSSSTNNSKPISAKKSTPQTHPNKTDSDSNTINSVGNNSEHISSLITTDISTLTVNGGPCLLRRGLWSQTITETVVYLPLTYLLQLFSDITQQSDTEQYNSKKSPWKVEFSLREISISHKNVVIFTETLQYSIVPTQSLWMIESDILLTNNEINGSTSSGMNLLKISDIDSTDTTYHSSTQRTPQHIESYLTLHLHKSPPVITLQSPWTPGCEWWERVFPGDERIDTMGCSVGTDQEQLPVEARDRAQQEHSRFSALSESDRRRELDYMMGVKKAFATAELSSRADAITEDRAIQAVPERAEMLDNLRSEFPHIQFTAK